MRIDRALGNLEAGNDVVRPRDLVEFGTRQLSAPRGRYVRQVRTRLRMPADQCVDGIETRPDCLYVDNRITMRPKASPPGIIACAVLVVGAAAYR